MGNEKELTIEQEPKSKRVIAEANSNIRFAGKHQAGKIGKNGKRRSIPQTAPASIIVGGKNIKLPSSAQQHAGFYRKDAAEIIRQYRSLYKVFEVKERKGSK
jgi:hypothetical protein